MTRVLTKGTRTGVENNHATWDEAENLIDHNLAFYDLATLEEQKHEVTHPAFSLDNSITLPSHTDVAQYLDGGNDLFIRLPTQQTIKLRGEDHDGNTEYYDCDLLKWLPFAVSLDSEKTGDLYELEESYQWWDWYFTDGFEWETTIDYLCAQPWYGRTYTDPRPPKSEPHIKSRSTPPATSYGPDAHGEIVAVNNVDRPIAVKIKLEDTSQDEIYRSEGDVFLIPPHPSLDFGHFVRGILEREYGLDVEPKPEWVDDYPIPGESEVEQEIEVLREQLSDIEEQIEQGEWFRQLLFAKDEQDDDYNYELEEPVREAFRSVGLSVSGEKPGKRDGAIQLEDHTFVLEITGTTRGVSPTKVDRLERHVQDAENEKIGEEVTGLLIPNADCQTDPLSRMSNAQNYADELAERGYKMLTAYQVYRMLCLYDTGELSAEDIIDRLTGDELIIEFDGTINEGSASLRNRVESLRARLQDIF